MRRARAFFRSFLVVADSLLSLRQRQGWCDAEHARDAAAFIGAKAVKQAL